MTSNAKAASGVATQKTSSPRSEVPASLFRFERCCRQLKLREEEVRDKTQKEKLGIPLVLRISLWDCNESRKVEVVVLRLAVTLLAYCADSLITTVIARFLP